MGKWMIIVDHPLDELKQFGGFLTKLKVNLHKDKQELAVHERPYVVYLSAADVDLPKNKHVSCAEMMKSVLDVSKFLGFNYNILYKGRGYYNNTELMREDELSKKLINEIKLVRPQFIFMSGKLFFLQSLLKEKFPEINYLCGSEHYGNYFNILKREVFEFNDIDQLCKAFTLYGDLKLPFPSKESWEYKYYTLAIAGAEIEKDFVERYDVAFIGNTFGLYDLANIEMKSTDTEVKLEEIL